MLAFICYFWNHGYQIEIRIVNQTTYFPDCETNLVMMSRDSNHESEELMPHSIQRTLSLGSELIYLFFLRF